MPQDQAGFKGLVISYLKANKDVYSLPDEFKVYVNTYDPEKGAWVSLLDIMGETNYRRISIDAEDLFGFIWDKLSTIGVSNGQG